ncbi:MAG: family 10 glycosylhydrolase [Kiritimatiellales bacterium]|nr:family 10 glycosylhydrolase [Kiritimatiellales bacterium]
MKRFCVLFGCLLAVTALVAVLYVAFRAADPAPPPVRALWVTRFDYRTPEDVRSIIRNVADAGFTDVFFQIRGNGTTFYPSRIEPRAYELSGNSVDLLGADPGWDPLQLAIDEAKPAGLRVHAYMNVLPGWKGLSDPPVEAEQLWTAHPDWFMVDSTGAKMLPTSGWYAFVNPVLPEVRAHLRGIVKELCRYDVAGIHLDYIRYPYDYHLVAGQRYPDAPKEELMRHADFSYDPASQAALLERYGWKITKKEITQFRCESVTRLVRDISYVMQLEKPGRCVLSAAVLGNPVDGRNHAYQDSGAWARTGLVDWIVQMNYGTKSFTRYLGLIRKAAGRRGFGAGVVVGVNCENDAEIILRQIDAVRHSGARGVALFSYTYLFDDEHRLTEKGRTLLPKIRP